MSTNLIRIGEAEFPPSLATSGVTVLGQPETGKTNVCKLISEQLMRIGVPTVEGDPKGDFWGIRLNAAGDGPSEFDVAIFGGDHSDLELTEDAGKAVADAIVDARASAILDLSAFESGAAQRRFMSAWAKRMLFRKKDDTYPMTIVLDEVDLFAPQNPQKDGIAATTLHNILMLRKLGRKRGIGLVANAQRSSSIHKNLVEMSDLLIFTQLSGRNDVAMIRDVLQYQLEPKALREMLGQIARLQKGEAYFYSPSKFKMNGIYGVPLATTFDSSRTPEIGDIERHPVDVRPIDLTSLRKSIAEAGTNLDKADVDELKATIVSLRAQLAAPKAEPQAEVRIERVPEVRVERIEVPALTEADRAILDRIGTESGKLVSVMEAVAAGLPSVSEAVQNMRRRVEASSVSASEAIANLQRAARLSDSILEKGVRTVTHGEVDRTKPPQPAVPVPSGTGASDLNRAERALLTALAQDGGQCDKARLSILSGYSANSSSFSNALGALRSAGRITRGMPVAITEDGRKALGHYEPLPTGAALRDHWLRHPKLGKAERALLAEIFTAFPSGLSKDELSERSGYSTTSSSFSNALGKLRSLLLIGRDAEIRASDDLFESDGA